MDAIVPVAQSIRKLFLCILLESRGVLDIATSGVALVDADLFSVFILHPLRSRPAARWPLPELHFH
jgi:hypothetical protein